MKALFLIKSLDLHEPLGIMQISSSLKNLGIETKAVITSEEKNLIEKVKNFNPDLILFSTTTGAHKYYLNLCRLLKKELKFISIFGGPHPTFFPEIAEEECVDFIIRGEAEEAIGDLIKKIQKGEKDIKKVWLGDYPQNLDSLPFPDRTLLKDYEYLLPRGVRFFMTSRGCPYDCTYCFNAFNKKLTKGRYLRQRSVENVIKEIKEVKNNFHLEKVNFQDDTFILNKRWLEEFLKIYKKEINLPLYCHIRPNLVDEIIIKDLKDAGCYYVVLGLEVGNDYIRNKILKRNMSKQQILNTCKLLRKYNIGFTTQTMMCLPEETLDMVFETIELSAKCKPTHINLYFYQPYPKTELANYSISRGLFDGNFDRLLYTYQAESKNEIPLNIKNKQKFKLLSDIFRVCVKFPFLIKFIKFDIKYIPLNPISRILRTFLNGFYFIKYGFVK